MNIEMRHSRGGGREKLYTYIISVLCFVYFVCVYLISSPPMSTPTTTTERPNQTNERNKRQFIVHIISPQDVSHQDVEFLHITEFYLKK